jgi:hypothetical protein
MKTILTLITLLTCVLGFSQDCKFVKKEEVDEISGLPVVMQKAGKTINYPGFYNLQIFYRTNRCWIHLTIILSRGGMASQIAFNSKTPIVFYFSDSTNLSLLPSNDYNSLGGGPAVFFGVLDAFTSEQWDKAFYSISKEQVKLLATKTVERVRICFTPSFIGEPIKDSNQIVVRFKESHPNHYGKKRIQSLSRCILDVNFLDPGKCVERQQSVAKRIETKSEDQMILEKIESGSKYTESNYQNFEEVKTGDIVTYISLFGDRVYGFVTEKKGTGKIRIKSYAGANTPIFVDENFKKVIKIEIPK